MAGPSNPNRINNSDSSETNSTAAGCAYHALITLMPFLVFGAAALKLLFDAQSSGQTTLSSKEIFGVATGVGAASSVAANVIDCLCNRNSFFRSSSPEDIVADETSTLILPRATS